MDDGVARPAAPRAAARPGVVPLLLGVAALAALLGAVSLVLLRTAPWAVLRDPASPLVPLLDVRAEANLHTFVNVALLVLAAGAHAGAGALARVAGRPAWPWALTCALLLLLALDDLASLHERLEPLGRALGGGEGALHFAWLVPGAAAAVGVLAAAWVAARRVPPAAARYLAAGVVVLLVAAVGLEAVGGAVLSGRGDGPLYAVVSHVEEWLETVAAGLLVCPALVAVRGRRTADGGLSLRYDDGPADASG